MEAVIVSGLKRPESERPVPAGAFGSWPDPRRSGSRATRLVGQPVAWLGARLRALTLWAARRSIAPTSLAGSSVALALCAAAWLSGGGGTYTIRGAAAVCGWYAMLFGARGVAAHLGGHGAEAEQRVRRPAFAPDGSTDWLVLPKMTWDDGEPLGLRSGSEDAPSRQARHADARHADARQADAPSFGWVAAFCTVAGESAIYGGIAAGGGARNEWLLAVMTIASITVAETILACRSYPASGRPFPEPVRFRSWWRWLDRLAAPSAGWRVLIAMGVLAAAGPWRALEAVFVVEAASICWVVAAVSFRWPSARFAVPASAYVLMRCRDDGPAARWAGRLVKGGLLPLPPAFVGLFATALLAGLGLRSLRGFVAMTPPVVTMLASGGSSHPHDGRSDWLVPVMLVATQYLYLATLGFALAVPGPLVFASCALLALWQVSQAAGGPLTASGIGWDGRMFGVGFAAVIGFPTVGYIGLAAFLGALIGRKLMAGRLVPGEIQRR